MLSSTKKSSRRPWDCISSTTSPTSRQNCVWWKKTLTAQKVQANLQAIGINVDLSGSPTGTWLTSYRSGKMAFGLSLWGPDFPDPADYLTFAPGELVGLRAGWSKGTSAVSAITMRMCPMGVRSSSATACASEVRMFWPSSTLPV